MDKNTIIGFVMIFAIIFGYQYITKPSEAEIAKQKHERDSIQLVVRTQQLKDSLVKAKAIEIEEIKIANTPIDSTVAFATTKKGEESFITLENKKLKLTISKKGGRVYSAELKEHKTFDGKPLVTFNGDDNMFGLRFFTDRGDVSTNNLYFASEASIVDASVSSQSLSLRLKATNNSYIEYVYTLEPDSYKIGFDINMVGMNEVLPRSANFVNLEWKTTLLGQEKGHDWENQYTGLYYKPKEDAVDYLSLTSENDEEKIATSIKWLSFKQQFFATTLIAKDAFQSAELKSHSYKESTKLLKTLHAEAVLPYKGNAVEKFGFDFIISPSHYNTLKEYGNDMEEMVPLGWGIFGWMNKILVIPVFNFLDGFIVNYGLIILLLTLIIKLIIFPLTYKSYLSTAKMRVLKPQIDEINAKIPKDKAMERQKATMALYKKVGVNPMGGCIPMVIQMPVLFAMFRFFPTSFELRQQPFLWSNDLSAYDSIYQLPFEIPMYGDHISLFTLLMAVSMILITKLNTNQTPQNNAMPGMKMMTYMMPVMMLLWFNNYACGLSYYYLLSNVITLLQTYVIRSFVDDKKILKKLELNKKKPQKKSKFMERMETMAKQKQKQQKRK